MKLSKQGVIDADAVFKYLSDHDLFPKGVKRVSVKNTGKNGIKSSPSIPAPEEVPVLPDEHGRGVVPKRNGQAKVRKVRRKGHG